MSLVFAHWSFDPFLVIVAAVALVHERGLRRLAKRSTPERVRLRRNRSWFFYGGLAVLVLAVCSPIDYWSDSYFYIHMIQHLLLMFAAPAPIVAGAPWTPLEHGIPASVRRPVMRFLLLGRPTAPLRSVVRTLWQPWVAVIGFQAVVVFWHLPGPFDLAEENQTVHIWLMHGSFFLFGLAFWLQLIPSRPFVQRLRPPAQMAAIFSTACVFWLLAMALSIFSKGSWYPWYQLHEGSGLTPFADQQIGAGIMWTCGIFWAIPAMVAAVRRLIEESGDGVTHL